MGPIRLWYFLVLALERRKDCMILALERCRDGMVSSLEIRIDGMVWTLERRRYGLVVTLERCWYCLVLIPRETSRWFGFGPREMLVLFGGMPSRDVKDGMVSLPSRDVGFV